MLFPAGTRLPIGADGNVNFAKPTGMVTFTDGYIGSRKEAVTKLQSTLTDRQAVLKNQFDNAYNRYLAQFTQLQSLQSQMSGTTSMFEAMFSKSDS